MFKTILATTAAATLAALTFAQPANAGVCYSCGYWNGVSLNGVELNGIRKNGIRKNGIKKNGMGSDSSAFRIDGIELPARVR